MWLFKATVCVFLLPAFCSNQKSETGIISGSWSEFCVWLSICVSGLSVMIKYVGGSLNKCRWSIIVREWKFAREDCPLWARQLFLMLESNVHITLCLSQLLSLINPHTLFAFLALLSDLLSHFAVSITLSVKYVNNKERDNVWIIL